MSETTVITLKAQNNTESMCCESNKSESDSVYLHTLVSLLKWVYLQVQSFYLYCMKSSLLAVNLCNCGMCQSNNGIKTSKPQSQRLNLLTSLRAFLEQTFKRRFQVMLILDAAKCELILQHCFVYTSLLFFIHAVTKC